jgi:hypothetical protein
MADAPTKDVRPAANPVKGPKKVSFGETVVEMGAGVGDAARWKKKADALSRLDSLQEEASNHVSTAMSSFVQRTSIVKEVCTPSSPQATWQMFEDDPLWCSKRNYIKFCIV